MATLREMIGVNTDTGRAAQLQEQDIANGMGEIAKGWTSGRIATDANALAADEVSLRANGDIAGADSLRGQIGQLQQRQQMYAPAVGRVEDIGGIGQAASWFGGRVGQGAASMIEPVAAGAATGGAMRLAGLLPGGVGKAARALSPLITPAVPFAINQRQMTGEFVNDAVRDPELMARTSPTELRNAANLYGVGAGALDTVLPHMVGKQLSGAGLRQGLSSTGPLAKMAGGMAMEGGTELAQGKASQFTQGYLNPNRDTSGDFSDDINNFAGGAAGGAPFAGAGALADTGYRRVGNTAERLGDGLHDLATGTVAAGGKMFDAASGAAAPYVKQAKDKGKAWWKQGSDAAVDLKQEFAGEDGKLSGESIMGKLKAVAQDAGASLKKMDAERTILSGEMPAEIAAQGDDAAMDWMDANDAARAQLVTDKLAGMADDPQALTLLKNLVEAGTDRTAQSKAVAPAAKFLLDRMPSGRAAERASKLGEAAGAVGGVLGRVGMAAGKAALGAGKALVAGAKEGASKKNMQANEAQGDESFAQWRDRVYEASGQKVAEQALTEGASYKKAQEFSQRAELAGSYAEDMAKRAWPKDRSMGMLMRRTAYAIADMSEAWDTAAASTGQRDDAAVLRPGGREAKLNRIADDLRQGYGLEAPSILAAIGSIMGARANGVVDYMKDELAQQMAPKGVERTKQLRAQLANDLIDQLGVAERQSLMAQGVNLHDPDQSRHVLELMEDYADGIGTEKGSAQRRGLDSLFGKEGVDKMLAMLNGLPEKDKVGSVVDDRGESGAEMIEPGEDDGPGATDYEQRQGEKLVVKGSGSRVYGFHATANLRTNDEVRDPFAAMEAPGEDGVARRPKLFTKGQQLFGGKGDALEKKIADIRALLVEDPDYPDHDTYRVEAKSAHDVMTGLGLQPGKVLQLFRDYVHADYNDEKASPEAKQQSSRMASLAGKLIADTIQMQNAKTGAKDQKFRTSPAERKEVRAAAAEYFKNRFVVVGEQLSNRDPDKIGVTEVMALAKAGAGLRERARGTTHNGEFTALPLDEQHAKLTGANLLTFKGKDGKALDIPAGKLVNWVRKQRGAEDADRYSNRDKDDAYLADVLEGISALVASGYVQGLPSMTNKFGKTEYFSGQGVPGALRLATTTYGNREFGRKKRLEDAPDRRQVAMGPANKFKSDEDTDARMDEDYQDEVAADADQQADWFTPDDREQRELVVDNMAGMRSKRRSGKDDKRTAAEAQDAGGELVTREAGRGTSTKLRVDVSGSVAPEPKIKTDPLTGLDKTDRAGYDGTEMDFFPKKKDSEVAGDFDDQQWLTKQTNPRFEGGPEPKGTAVSSAEFRASKITEAFLNDPAKGQEMVKSRIRAAMRPEYTGVKPARGKYTVPGVAGKDQVVGGPHYIAPVAAFINPKNLTDNNIDMSGKAISAVQQRVAGILLKGDLSKTEKLKIARLMSVEPTTLTAMNVDAKLAWIAEGAQPAAKAMSAKVEPVGKEVAAGLGKPSGAVNVWHGSGENAELSNLAARPFEVGGKQFVSVEHAYQSWKSGAFDQVTFDKYKVAGRKIPGTLGTKSEGGWNLRMMKKLVKASFGQNPDAAEKLLATGNAQITHTQDRGVWAAEFPRVLTEVRSELGKPRGGSEQAAPSVLNAQSRGGPDKFDAWKDGPTAKAEGHMRDKDGNPRVATQAEMDAAVSYAKKVLGPKIKVVFQKITGYSGEFIDAMNTIVISTTAAAGTLGTLYHEAMHVFFRDFVKSNPKLQGVFEGLVNDPKHLAKLHTLLNGYPAAQAQLASGEERLAYTYQFWKEGLLQVDATAHTWLQKVGKFFRRVAGMVRDSERALELFQAFDNGKMSEPSAAGRVIAAAMAKGTMTMKTRARLDALTQGLAALTLPAGAVMGHSVSPMARKINKLMFTNPGDEAHGSERIGMMNARRNVTNQYGNRVKKVLAEMSDVDQVQVQKYLQAEAELKDIPDAGQRESVRAIREQLDHFHGYMVKAGMKIGKIERYYPTVWSTAALLDKKAEFVEMLTMNYAKEMRAMPTDTGSTAMKGLPTGAYSPRDAATRIWQALVSREGVDAHLPASREDGVLDPFFASQEQRTLPWLKGADKEKFLEKNMPLTLSRYFGQGAHATEYFRRFGKGGTKLDDMLHGSKLPAVGGGFRREEDGVVHDLERASKEKLRLGEIKDEKSREKWVARQMRDISMSVGAMEGALGKDISPNMRTFNSWMTTYQNIRLLPMSLFSSFVDPLALVARGAPLQAAYETFVYSMKEVWSVWADAFRDMPAERQKDEWRELSEHIGASEVAMFSHHVADQYSSTYMTAGAKKLNDKMFVLNGMEGWNRGTRVMATKWATRFIEKHVGLPDATHSARWLKELGLTPDMVTLDDGKLVTNVDQLAVLKGITVAQAERQMAPIYNALNRWVEGAVLTPNAAQRPAWSSDPNYATMFHLKQFSYSFHETILKRAVSEFKHGNLAPVGALAMFIPTMITADVVKGLIQGGGELPAYMSGMDAGDWFTHGINRAGLTGIGNVGTDAAHDWASLGGPAVEQIIDGARDGFGDKTLLRAMPLHAVYSEAVRGAMAVSP